MDDINASYNTIVLKDDPLGISTPRSGSFINLKLNRQLIDSRENYNFANSNIDSEDLIKGYVI